MEDAAFAALRWTRLRGSVRNLHAAGAREHPLWILHSLLMFCVPEAAKNGQSRFLFRPLAEPGDVIERDRLYPFAVFFPGDDLALARACAAGLERHLSDKRHHFALVELESPQVRSLADLEDAASRWPERATEVCLEFETPFAYTPADGRRPWWLAASDLGRLLAHRFQHFFVCPAPPPRADWATLTTLCHFWRFVEHRHRAKSGRGTKTIAGNVGPLFLRGTAQALASVRQWLLLGTEIGAGLKLGPRGHYRLRFDRPWFDPIFCDPATYTRALDDLKGRSGVFIRPAKEATAAQSA